MREGGVGGRKAGTEPLPPPFITKRSNVMNSAEPDEFPQLEKALVDFYNQTKKLFIDITPPHCGLLPEAIMGKPENGQNYTSFAFDPFVEHHCSANTFRWRYEYGTLMEVSTENVTGNPTVYHSTISVNTASYAFEKWQKNNSGFEETLLHEMIHIKDKMAAHLDFEYHYTRGFDYAMACQLIAEVYPVTAKGGRGYFSSKPTSERIASHDVRFMTLCYHLAKKLLTQKKLLKRVLAGSEVQGDNTWQKRKWLAILLYGGGSESEEEYLEFICDKPLGYNVKRLNFDDC
jgi:hypothetical protein